MHSSSYQQREPMPKCQISGLSLLTSSHKQDPYLSRDVPLQLLRTWQVGMRLTTAVTFLSISQLNRVHGKDMLQHSQVLINI